MLTKHNGWLRFSGPNGSGELISATGFGKDGQSICPKNNATYQKNNGLRYTYFDSGLSETHLPCAEGTLADSSHLGVNDGSGRSEIHWDSLCSANVLGNIWLLQIGCPCDIQVIVNAATVEKKPPTPSLATLPKNSHTEKPTESPTTSPRASSGHTSPQQTKTKSDTSPAATGNRTTATITSAPPAFSTEAVQGTTYYTNQWITTTKDGHKTVVPVISPCPFCPAVAVFGLPTGAAAAGIIYDLPHMLPFQLPEPKPGGPGVGGANLRPPNGEAAGRPNSPVPSPPNGPAPPKPNDPNTKPNTGTTEPNKPKTKTAKTNSRTSSTADMTTTKSSSATETKSSTSRSPSTSSTTKTTTTSSTSTTITTSAACSVRVGAADKRLKARDVPTQHLPPGYSKKGKRQDPGQDSGQGTLERRSVRSGLYCANDYAVPAYTSYSNFKPLDHIYSPFYSYYESDKCSEWNWKLLTMHDLSSLHTVPPQYIEATQRYATEHIYEIQQIALFLEHVRTSVTEVSHLGTHISYEDQVEEFCEHFVSQVLGARSGDLPGWNFAAGGVLDQVYLSLEGYNYDTSEFVYLQEDINALKGIFFSNKNPSVPGNYLDALAMATRTVILADYLQVKNVQTIYRKVSDRVRQKFVQFGEASQQAGENTWFHAYRTVKWGSVYDEWEEKYLSGIGTSMEGYADKCIQAARINIEAKIAESVRPGGDDQQKARLVEMQGEIAKVKGIKLRVGWSSLSGLKRSRSLSHFVMQGLGS